MKPLGRKAYGSIPHLPQSRMGPADHACHQGQARICTVEARDKHDLIVVQEKLDGSNVAVARLDGQLYPLTRAGYLADTSPYEQHWRFGQWVYLRQQRFLDLLEDGERVCGEWLMQAHGTRYRLTHEPFVAFDIMREAERALHEEMSQRCAAFGFVVPAVLHKAQGKDASLSVEHALRKLGRYGFHGALDRVEGAVWRVERSSSVDFLAKYVRPDKVDGCYLPELNGGKSIWNWSPGPSVASQ